jgi:hypothetical protein
MEEQEKIIVNFGDKLVTLHVTEFDTDIDMDDVLKIDYNNVLGEVLTFPVIVNRCGALRAEMEHKVSEAKFELEVYKAKLTEMFRKNGSSSKTEEGGTKTVKQPTIQQLENLVLLDEGYQLKQKKYFKVIKNYQYLDSLYWAAKDKSKKLDFCSNSLKPTDFENDIVSSTINGVLIKVHQKLIK